MTSEEAEKLSGEGGEGGEWEGEAEGGGRLGFRCRVAADERAKASPGAGLGADQAPGWSQS